MTERDSMTASRGETPETDDAQMEADDAAIEMTRLSYIASLERQRDEAVALLRELFAIEEGPGETDRPQWQKVRAFLASLYGGKS